jgi:hypothetical protein
MGKKLTIFMLDGTPSGAKTVEIGNWSGKAIFAPRASLKNILQRSEFESPGVYFLKNESSAPEYNDSVYIGEAEELRARLKTHIAERDFESVICLLSKDELLTKAHIKYLESRLISIARESNSSLIENNNSPKLSRISEADVSDMEYFIEQIRLILPVVGFQTLVAPVQHSKANIEATASSKQFSIKSKLISATMIESDDGFIVLSCSQASKNLSNSIADGWIKIRKKLIDAGVLIENGEQLKFIENASFSSPSAASSVVLGRQAPGPVSWIDSNGKTYKEIQEAQTNA